MCTTHCTASACKNRALHLLRAFVWSLAFGLGFVPFSSSAGPEWWGNVLKPNTPAMDYAAANQGQLKNFAAAARDELLAKGVIEAGHPIDLMVDAWTDDSSHAKDYAPVNLGQLKAVAAPFYDLLIERELRPMDSYPWSNSSRPANDYAIANIGQLKAVFDFDVSNPDLDGDGMSDVFEQQIIDADPVDAITFLQDVKPLDDYDGDRIPNLWEEKRQTDPLDAASVPGFDASVAHGQGLRDTYLGLPGGDYCSVVRVERGTHPGGIPQSVWIEDRRYEKVGTRIVEVVDQVTGEVLSTFEEDIFDLVDYSSLVPVEPKKVLWLGDVGASRADGHEGAVIEMVNEGIHVSGTAVFDSMIVDGQAGINSPAITNYGHLRLSNSIIRHCSPANATGALLNAGSAELVHVTVHASHGQISSAGAPAVMREAILNEGTLLLLNSVVWDPRAGSGAAIAGNLGAVTIQASLTQGGQLGSLDSAPLLNAGGYLTAGSSVCFNAAAPQLVKWDIQNQPRPGLAADLGACQWVNTDASASDHLPDWWEQWWFGSLSDTDTGDPDLDTVGNLSEFLAMTAPTNDQDADGLPDAWEKAYWISISVMGPSGNPDNDERNNLAEYLAQTNPIEMDADCDLDDDGLMDVWERLHFGDIESYAGGDNPDDDQRTNLQEQAAGTNPLETDFDCDKDSDGLRDVWEKLYFHSITLHGADDDPDGDGYSNLLEQLYNLNPAVYNPANGDVDLDGWLDAWEITTFGTLSEYPGGDCLGNGVTNRERLAQLQALAQISGWNTDADLDDDGITMEGEWVKGTNPFSSDTDGDGVPDNLDPMPLDALVNATPLNVPGPPVLTLSSPVGATPLP